MNSAQRLIDKFSDFEPEVEEFVLEKKWEQIKYFIPEKPMKKSAGYWKNLGCFLLIGFIISIGVTGTLVYQKYHDRSIALSRQESLTPLNPLKAPKGVSVTRTTGPKIKAHPFRLSHSKAEERNNGPKAITRSDKRTGQKPQTFFLDPTVPGRKKLPFATVPAMDTVTYFDPVISNEVVNLSANPEAQSAQPRLFSTGDEILRPDFLPPLNLLLPEDRTLRKSFGQAIKRRLYSKAWYFSGLFGVNRIHLIEISKQAKAVNRPVLLVIVGRKFRPRLGLSLQLYVGGDGPVQNDGSASYNKVERVTPIPGTIFQRDTLYTYREIKGNKQLKPKAHYALGLSLDCDVFTKKRVALVASIAGLWRVHTGKVEETFQPASDTLNFIKSPGGPNLPNLIEADLSPGTKNTRSFQYAVAPALTVEYAAWSRLSFLCRLSYVAELSAELKTRAGMQKNTLLKFGLKWKLQ